MIYGDQEVRERRVKRNYYWLVYYDVIGADDPGYTGLVSAFVKTELKDGVELWKIGATYASHLEPTYYYVAAKNKKEAKERYKELMPWMTCFKAVVLIDGEERENILNSKCTILY